MPSVLTNPQDAHFWAFIALLVLLGVLRRPGWQAALAGLVVGGSLRLPRTLGGAGAPGRVRIPP